MRGSGANSHSRCSPEYCRPYSYSYADTPRFSQPHSHTHGRPAHGNSHSPARNHTHQCPLSGAYGYRYACTDPCTYPNTNAYSYPYPHFHPPAHSHTPTDGDPYHHTCTVAYPDANRCSPGQI